MLYLKNIELKNFRCHESFKIDLSKNINILIGKNATGKTSILESIYYLCLCKSFKTSDDKSLIKKGEDYFSIKADLMENDKNYKIISCFFKDQGKKVNVNDVIYKSLSKFYGLFNVVCFFPDDLKLIKGEPRLKRRFLDIYIGQSDKKYLKNLSDYNKILKERNEILKKFDGFYNDEALLNIYTNQLVIIGKEIIRKRKEFLAELEPYVNNMIMKISSGQEKVSIIYNMNVEGEKFESEIKKTLNVDKTCKKTTVGPHKDDIVFDLNGLDASVYASQGQQRTIALSLKLGLANLIKDKKGKVLVLLDDVFGELDYDRQAAVLMTVDKDTQVIITTTTLNNIKEEIYKQSNVITLGEKVI